MIFKSTSSRNGPPDYNERSGQNVTIIRPLTETEADLHETGPMYVIRFEDGVETHAFNDELIPTPEPIKDTNEPPLQ